MVREPQQRIVKHAPSALRPCDVESPPQSEPWPNAEKVSPEDRQADLDQTNAMISEGGPMCLTDSESIQGTRDEARQLTRMIQELQANQVALVGLRDQYGTFVFTGGDVPSGRCALHAVVSYLERPVASDRILVGELERYRRLVEATMEPRQDVSARPRTLRCRKALGDAFERASSEIQTLATALESVLANLLEELEPPFPSPSTGRLVNAVRGLQAKEACQ